MNFRLTPELEKFVADEVASGHFCTPSEVVCYAVRLLQQSEGSREEQIAEFNRELQARIEASDRGEYVTSEEAERFFREKSARRKAELEAARRA